jgi:hypothetical protein
MRRSSAVGWWTLSGEAAQLVWEPTIGTMNAAVLRFAYGRGYLEALGAFGSGRRTRDLGKASLAHSHPDSRTA